MTRVRVHTVDSVHPDRREPGPDFGDEPDWEFWCLNCGKDAAPHDKCECGEVVCQDCKDIHVCEMP